MEENYNENPDAEQIQTTGSGLSGGSGVFSGLSGMSDLEGEPLANQPSTDAESSPSLMVEEARSAEETGSLFTGGTQPSATSPPPQVAQYTTVSPVFSSPGQTMSPFSAKLEPSASVDSTATPIAEGSMNMPSLPAASPTSTGSYQTASSTSRRTSDFSTKARIGRSGVSTPGAVAVQPSQPAASQPPVMSRAEEDAMAKALGARPSRHQPDMEPAQPMIAPVAVALQPSQPVAIPRQTQQQPPEPTTPRAQPMRTQAQLDDDAKARARGGSSAMSFGTTASPHRSPRVDSMQADDRSAMDEMARRREERAQARAERLGVQSVGAVSVASSQDTREARKMEQASVPTSPRSTAATASSTGSMATSSFANMSEDERQRRYDAKMAQANLQVPESQAHDVQPNHPEKGMIITNTAQEDRDRRHDMKTLQADQEHSDNREKHGTSAGPEDDVYAFGRAQPNSMRSPGNLDKTDDFDLIDSSMPSTTAADRGMVVGSDVEHGQANENELAVAIAIDEEEEEEEKFYAYAVEYDPDSKPPLYKNRRCRLYGIVGTVCFIVLVVVLSVTIAVTGKNQANDVTTPPTASPTTARDNQYRKIFAEKVGDKVYEPGTPHYNAVEWIMNEDPMQLDVTDEGIVDRYMMAFLYFHSSDNGNKPWRSCNPPKEGEDDNCVASVFTRLDNDTITFIPRPGATRWLSGRDVCQWEGIQCQGGTTVLGFELLGQNLTGTLPTELAELPLLQGISVPFNELTGTIPSEYASIRNLILLEVHGNLLTGSIPDEFYDGSLTLQVFNVGDNALSGQLDTRIGLMTELKGLHLYSNNLVGSFPTEVGSLSLLSFMRVNGNEFSGAVPTELANLRQLAELWLDGNIFSGTIPSEFGQFPRLQDLRFTGNRLSGTIPDELFNLPKLTTLVLDDMRLTGTLSPLVAQLSNLMVLVVSSNQLTGTIPSEISLMTNLEVAWLHNNTFTGQVPDVICGLVPEPLFVLQADCFPVENPTNFCRCCTACCDLDQQICTLTNSQI